MKHEDAWAASPKAFQKVSKRAYLEQEIQIDLKRSVQYWLSYWRALPTPVHNAAHSNLASWALPLRLFCHEGTRAPGSKTIPASSPKSPKFKSTAVVWVDAKLELILAP